MDFDESRLYFSHQQLQTRSDDAGQEEEPVNDTQESNVDIKAVRRHFREFLRKLTLLIAYIMINSPLTFRFYVCKRKLPTW